MKNKYSTIKQVDKNTFMITDYEVVHKGINLRFRFKTIFICVFIFLFILLMINIPQNNLSLNTTGFVFSDSSHTTITEEDISNLKYRALASEYTHQELLRFAINEIYARHGHSFSIGGKYSNFYNQFDWYNKLPKKKVLWSDFNSTESTNLNLLLQVEKENGYR